MTATATKAPERDSNGRVRRDDLDPKGLVSLVSQGVELLRGEIQDLFRACVLIHGHANCMDAEVRASMESARTAFADAAEHMAVLDRDMDLLWDAIDADDDDAPESGARPSEEHDDDEETAAT